MRLPDIFEFRPPEDEATTRNINLEAAHWLPSKVRRLMMLFCADCQTRRAAKAHRSKTYKLWEATQRNYAPGDIPKRCGIDEWRAYFIPE